MNIDDTMSAYLDYLKLERQLAAQTLSGYRKDLRQLDAFLNHPDITTITRDDLRRYMRAMTSDGKARATVRRRMQGYATYFKWLKYEGHRADVATEGLIIPKRKQKEAVYLTVQQLQTFADTYPPTYNYCIPERDRAAWRLLAFLGLRRSEIFNLRVEDVRFSEGQLTLRDTKDGNDASLHIPDAIVDDLRAAIGDRTEGYVCPGWGGGIWHGQSFCIALRHHLKACGLAGLGITSKALRHSFGTHLSLAGVPLPTINKLMRHKEIRTTMKYMHLHPDTLKAALEKLPITKKAS